MATDGHSTQPNLEMPDSISLINRTLASSPAVTLSLTLTLSPPKISVSWIVMPTPALSQLLDAHLELYLARLQLERTQSPNTWAAYRTDLTQLRLWLAQGPCPDSGRAVEDDSATPSPPDPLTSQLLAYITQLHESGLSANSIARKTSAIRSFFQYILENQHISDSIDLLSASGPAGTPLPLGTPPLHDQDTEPQPQTLPVSQPMTRQVAQPMPGFTLPTLHNNPVDTLPRPRIERHLPQALPWEAVDQILNYVLSPFRTPPTLAARDRALVFLLYACGLRVSELCSLTTADYVRGSGYLRISGKGQKERICPVAQAALTHLDHWLDEERPKLNPTTSSILINHRGAPLSRQGVWKVLGSLGTGAGVEKKLHPHLFRHTFATHLLSGGAPLRTIQILLGHSDLSTTQIYTSVAPTELAETVLRCHPRGHPRRHPRGGPAQN